MKFRQLIKETREVDDIGLQVRLQNAALAQDRYDLYWLHKALYWGAGLYHFNKFDIIAFKLMVFAYKAYRTYSNK